MTRIASPVALLAMVLFRVGSAGAQDTLEGVAEIDQITSVRLAWRGKRTKPTIVTDAVQLAKVMPSRADTHRVLNRINFKKQKLLIFAWEGDAQDRLTIDRQGSKIRFVHWGNAAGDDPHLHCKLFAINRGIDYLVTVEPDPR